MTSASTAECGANRTWTFLGGDRRSNSVVTEAMRCEPGPKPTGPTTATSSTYDSHASKCFNVNAVSLVRNRTPFWYISLRLAP